MRGLPLEVCRFVWQKALVWVHRQVMRLALPAPSRRPELEVVWERPADPGDFVRFEEWVATGERQWVGV